MLFKVSNWFLYGQLEICGCLLKTFQQEEENKNSFKQIINKNTTINANNFSASRHFFMLQRIWHVFFFCFFHIICYIFCCIYIPLIFRVNFIVIQFQERSCHAMGCLCNHNSLWFYNHDDVIDYIRFNLCFIQWWGSFKCKSQG